MHLGTEASSAHLAELQRTFVAPAPLTQSAPREVELTGGGLVLATVGVLLLVMAVVTGVGLHREVQRQAGNRQDLIEEGVTVTGEVTRLWANGDNRRQVAFRFVADGHEYSGRARVSDARRRTLELGSPLAVRYVPANPQVHDLGGAPRGTMPVWVPFLVAPLVAGAGLLCLVAIGRQRRLLTDGRVAPAIVTGHQKHRTQHGTHRSLTFEFPLLSGAVASGKSGASSKASAVGSVICVVYDPERPSRHRPYPMSLVRPAQ
jgi:hypothetical protein